MDLVLRWSLLLVPGIVAVSLLRRAGRPVDANAITGWAVGRGLEPVAHEDRELIGRYLRRSRLFRRAGLLAPLLLVYAAVLMSVVVAGEPTSGSPVRVTVAGPLAWLANPLLWPVGYAVGGVVAELTWTRPRAGRGAVLRRRQVAHYLPGWALWSIRLLPLLAMVLLGLVAAAPLRPAAAQEHQLGRAGAATLLIVTTGIVVELATRLLVARPQPVTSEQDAAVDDAIRSTSVRSVAGAGLATMLWLVAQRVGHLWDLAEIGNIGDGVGWVYATNTLGTGWAVLLLAGSVAWWRLAGDHPWRVRRTHHQQPSSS